MQVHPTRVSSDLAIAGMAMMGTGLLLRAAAILAFGGAILVGLAIARGVTRIGVSRVRSAGFEMLWRGEERKRRVARNEAVELEAEVRNRDSRAARFVGLRAVASPELRVEVEPGQGEVPAGGRLRVSVRVTPLRVGRHAVHGLSLEVQGSPGLFEVPLTFANPYGLEVLPQPYALFARSARGGRSRHDSDQGRSGPFAGEGGELRELREHQSGDPFRRIAWRASAKRGVLMVREYEREQRDVVAILLDASVEFWAGAPGQSALDGAVDQAASLALRHLQRGDRVGLAVVGARTLGFLKPDRGPVHAGELLKLLAHSTGCLDSDRSGLDEADVGARVLEHMRPLDPGLVGRVSPRELDRIARRADKLRLRAPFPEADVYAGSRRERTLRRYLAAYGVGSPARLEPDRPRTDLELGRALLRVRRQRPEPSIVYVFSSAPDFALRPALERALAEHPRRRAELCWVTLHPHAGIGAEDSGILHAASDALRLQALAAEQRGERALRRLGVRVARLRTPPRWHEDGAGSVTRVGEL
jgi:uncharacterized protein (DUF58 family)